MKIPSALARVSFLLYLFFALFGTKLPFQEPPEKIDEMVASNVVNQVVFSVLFLLSAASLVNKRRQAALFAGRGRYLALFLLWCLLSIGWSEYGFVSFKRIFQILTMVSVCLAVLLHVDAEDILKYLYVMLAVYVVLSLASVAAVPGAIDPVTGGWRGLSSHKNSLGQIALAGVVVFSNRAGRGAFRSRALSLLLAVLSLVLLAGSRSMTSIMALAMLAALAALYAVDDRFRELGLGRSFSLAALATGLGVVLAIWWLAPDMFRQLPALVGKDPSLTGRTEMWTDLFNEFRKHPLVGCGFGGFWVLENPDLVAFYQDYPFLPVQAHLGYLDILNETGIVGLLLFCLIVLHYFRNLSRCGTARIWTWFLVSGLAINFTETVLFRQHVPIGVLFVLSYLALFANAGKGLEKERAVRMEMTAPVQAAYPPAGRAVPGRGPSRFRRPVLPAD